MDLTVSCGNAKFQMGLHAFFTRETRSTVSWRALVGCEKFGTDIHKAYGSRAGQDSKWHVDLGATIYGIIDVIGSD